MMTRLTLLLALLSLSGTTAFLLPFPPADLQQRLLLATANDDTDFDAPILKNPVMKTDAPTVLDHEIEVVDDECYLGKYGQYDDCVDFDPMHEAKAKVIPGHIYHSLGGKESQAKAAFEMPDFTAIGEEISAAFGKLFAKK